jgi:hypothetical protein
MSSDEAIEEIRKVRQEISEEYGHDTKSLLDHYKELEQKFKDRILSKEKVIKA